MAIPSLRKTNVKSTDTDSYKPCLKTLDETLDVSIQYLQEVQEWYSVIS